MSYQPQFTLVPWSIAASRRFTPWPTGAEVGTRKTGRYIRCACVEFEQRAGQINSPHGAKSALVLDAIQRQPGEFSISDLERACPGVSRDMIRHQLDQLKQGKRVKCLGAGRNARWQNIMN